MDDKFSVEWVPLEAVSRYEKNPRKNDPAVSAVAKSLEEFGWRQPIVVDADGVIVVGDTRYLAAAKLGHTRIPIHRAGNLSPEQAKAYRIADNKTGEFAAWDEALLESELRDLQASGYDLSQTAITEKELGRLFTRTLTGDADTDDGSEITPLYGVVCECKDEASQVELIEFLTANGYTCRALLA